MSKSISSGIMLTILLLSMYTMLNVSPAAGWSNGGFSTDPQNPNYGTHDWIAQHALDWLPNEEKTYIVNNLAAYLYGTELPDNGGAPDGIGDVALHHIYYWSNESIQDDASAIRAQAEYDKAVNYIKLGNVAMAVKTLGIMSHYVVNVSAFGHVMGSGTDWGSEVHHSDYETYVNERTNSYNDVFNTYLVFDGSFENISAYNASCRLAYDTTFDVDGDLTCVWMDQNYDWSNQTFKNRCGESLNLAVNLLADVLNTFYMQFIHDVAVIEITPFKTVVGQRFPLKVNVTVKNEGEFPHTFNVTVYADIVFIWNRTEVYASLGDQETITFILNTTGFAKGNYTISVNATAVLGETDTEDNTRIDGWVVVAMVGDISSDIPGVPDGKVDMVDMYEVAKRFGINYPDPRYVANYDVDGDYKIDMVDMWTAAKEFGKIDP